jgi:hypothetical protein
MTGLTLTSLAVSPAIFQTPCSSYLGIRSSFVCRTIIRSSSFRDYFYSKILIIEPTHGAPHAPNQRTRGPY